MFRSLVKPIGTIKYTKEIYRQKKRCYPLCYNSRVYGSLSAFIYKSFIGIERKSNDGKTKEILLDQKIHQYAESFTIHGLPRVLTGSKTERISRTVFVIVAISLGGFMTYRYITKYFKYEVTHNFSKIKTDKAFYPSVTFCLPKIKERMEWFYLSDCVIPKRFLFDTVSNGIFNIGFCNVGGTNNCGNDSVRWRNDLKGICFTLFPTKKYYQLTETALFSFYVADDLLEIKQISVTIHDQNIDPLFLTPQLHIVPEQKYVVNLRKIVSKRLAHPFPSNCTNKTKDHNFPGNYNRRACLFVNRYLESYKKSNVMTSVGELYIQEKMIRDNNYIKKYPHETYPEAVEEFYQMFTEIDWGSSVCPLSCYDVVYESTYSFQSFSDSNELLDGTIEDKTGNLCQKFQNNFTRFEYFHIELAFEYPELFELLEEKQAYTFENLCAELGGFLGLMIGISIISVVEMLAYVPLLLMKKVQKFFQCKS